MIKCYAHESQKAGKSNGLNFCCVLILSLSFIYTYLIQKSNVSLSIFNVFMIRQLLVQRFFRHAALQYVPCIRKANVAQCAISTKNISYFNSFFRFCFILHFRGFCVRFSGPITMMRYFLIDWSHTLCANKAMCTYFRVPKISN